MDDDADLDVAVLAAAGEVGGGDEHVLLVHDQALGVEAGEGAGVCSTGIVVEIWGNRGTANTWLYAAATVGSGSEARELLCAANGDPGTLRIPAQALQHIGGGVELDFPTVSVASLPVDGVDVHF